MSNGDRPGPRAFPVPSPRPSPNPFAAREREFERRLEARLQEQREAFQPPVAPIPGIGTPTPVFIPPAPAAAGPSFGSIAARFGLPAAIGAIAVELLERVLGELQAKKARDFLDEAEAEIEMIRGRIEVKRKIRQLQTQTEGAVDIPPPGRPPPGLSDQDRFPFPDPAESPLGDDPFPGRVVRDPKPIGTVVRLPEDECITDTCVERRFGLPPEALPSPAPTKPAPIGDPALPAPTLPQPAPAPKPVTRPGTAPRPKTAPAPAPLPSPVRRAAPFRVPFFVGLPFPAPLAQPQPRPIPDIRTPPETIPTDLTAFDPRTVPFGPIQTRPSNCPPCEAEEDKPRTECWKKLVKEGLLPSQDESFNWVRIDCITGREL